MKAFSIKKPWAALIFGVQYSYRNDGKDFIAFIKKDIENCSWPLWRYFKPEDLPVKVYIHVPLKDDQQAMEWLLSKGLPPIVVLSLYGSRFITGAIIGEVDITGCVEKSESPWFTGPYGFTLSNPVLYEKPIPCKGKLGFFETDIEVHNA